MSQRPSVASARIATEPLNRPPVISIHEKIIANEVIKISFFIAPFFSFS